jgi:hypothetical protein
VLPNFRPQWTARKGAQELYDAYRSHGFTAEDMNSGRYFRIHSIQRLLGQGKLDASLHWKVQGPEKTLTVPITAS